MCLEVYLVILCVYINDGTAMAGNSESRERRGPGTAKAENDEGPEATFSTRSSSCQGMTLKGTWDILTV